MKDNIIALPVGRIRRDTPINRRKQYLDQDLMVNLVESNPDHIARREARRAAYWEARQHAQEDNDRLLMTVGTASMVTMLATLIGLGLWL